MTLRYVIPTLAMLVAPLSAQADTQPTHGYWLTENGKAIVEFAPCGTETCGKMVWISNPHDSTGKLKLDANNSDNAMKARPLCGLTLLGGLKDKGRAQSGWIYNPRDGSTYSVNVEALSEERLKVRGFLGIQLLGSSQVWTRVSDDRGGCGS